MDRELISYLVVLASTSAVANLLFVLLTPVPRLLRYALCTSGAMLGFLWYVADVLHNTDPMLFVGAVAWVPPPLLAAMAADCVESKLRKKPLIWGAVAKDAALALVLIFCAVGIFSYLPS